MDFEFPEYFELGGQTITVLLKKSMSEIDAHGMARFDAGEIWFDDDIKPNDLKAITFYHELIHFIFQVLGRNELMKDEVLVGSMASLLWQSQKTAKYK